MSTHVDGYITDVPYVHAFIHELAPAWLDYVAVVSGIRPPARMGGFTWCDLGCGQGLTAAMLAAVHPAGQFYGWMRCPNTLSTGGGSLRKLRSAMSASVPRISRRHPI